MLRIGIITGGHDWFEHPLWQVSETVTTVLGILPYPVNGQDTVPIDSQATRGKSVFIEIGPMTAHRTHPPGITVLVRPDRRVHPGCSYIRFMTELVALSHRVVMLMPTPIASTTTFTKAGGQWLITKR